MSQSRNAFTLVEVLVALILVTLAVTAFSSYNFLMVRRLADLSRANTSTSLAHTRAERAIDSLCTPESGTDTTHTVTAHWTTAPISTNSTNITITTSYNTLYGPHTESYTTAGPCQ